MILPINKPAGITSHDVVNRVRRRYGIKKVGHAGTLDPFATGVLVIMVTREATKLSQEYMAHDKEYVAELKLGYESDSHDKDGYITEIDTKTIPERAELEQALAAHVGEIAQIPPMHSAIKIGGKKLYELARKGQTIERPPRQVTIHEIELLDYTYPVAKVRISCGSGTYIRAIARDVGRDLKVGAYLESLVRTKSGDITLADCYALDALPNLPTQD